MLALGSCANKPTEREKEQEREREKERERERERFRVHSLTAAGSHSETLKYLRGIRASANQKGIRTEGGVRESERERERDRKRERGGEKERGIKARGRSAPVGG